MRCVDAPLAVRLRTIDAAVLGRRLRDARISAGLTQTELADGSASTAYVSRIESGQRRPTPRLLEALARRAGVEPETLLAGIAPDLRGALRLELDYAELEVRAGDGAAALARAQRVLDQLHAADDETLAGEAHLVRAYALESVGRLDDAITTLEDIVGGEPGVTWLRASVYLTRCYRESGDLSRAIDTGTAAMRRLEELGLAGTEEAIELAVTTASAYFESGDVRHAVRMCRRASERAEAQGSSRARAAAYWNASIMESAQGRVAAAIPLARRAVALMEGAHEHLSTAMLHTTLGEFLLALDPPEVEQATALLTQAREAMAWSEAGAVERSDNAVTLAHARFLGGDPDAARDLLEQVLLEIGDGAPLLRARALVLSGRMAGVEGDTDAARAHYTAAIRTLSAVGADRGAAQLWFDLGALLDEAGQHEEARDAYRRAAISTGLTARPSVVRVG